MTALSLARSRGVLVLLGTALLFVTAQIQIPLQPIPITLQTLAVMTLGLLFDRKTSVQAVLLYLSLGILGLPVFAGAKIGYLVGFLVAVWAMTSVREYLGEPKNIFELLGLNLLGSVLIYACGITWLSFSLGLHDAILLGFVPFILPGMIKAVLLSGVVRFFRGSL